ncbi:Protein of unknwon function [Oceanobacillus limi]|uniref:Protein of unknwon function n=1 Tax=Oceanobacillus limi TaxID=930131 RepID=A0A1I0EAP6_9BACI|nr:DUF3310 domain-containing protein [Oceanobacillus limi]SET42296.1 Protein of unknwon function [Oceanobacillus limi]
MKIRITEGRGWYTDKVGEVFDVVGRWGSHKYIVNNNGDTENYFVSDGYCEIVDESNSEADAINSPQHYTNGRFETIEIIEEITKGYDNGYVSYCVGNALKYLARAPYKHGEPTEDLRKAAKYIEFAIEHLAKEGE